MCAMMQAGEEARGASLKRDTRLRWQMRVWTGGQGTGAGTSIKLFLCVLVCYAGIYMGLT